MLVAEDEEGCFDEYKRKGLIANSANFVCQSLSHNIEVPPILSDVSTDEFNVIVIPGGTRVDILATRCNGVSECWNNEDEESCGLGQWGTTSIGNKYKIID